LKNSIHSKNPSKSTAFLKSSWNSDLVVDMSDIWLEEAGFTATVLQKQLFFEQQLEVRLGGRHVTQYGLKKQDSQQQFFKSNCILEQQLEVRIVG
jgi:hypothetical protein